MNEKENTVILPPAFGDVVPKELWSKIATKIIRHTPTLNVYDGITDMGSELLDTEIPRKGPFFWIIDELRPDLSQRLLAAKRTILVRCQYYEGGLQHRISFHAKLVDTITFKNYPALKLMIIPPVRQIVNAFIQIPGKDDKPLYLEVLVSGGDPEVRVVEEGAGAALSYSNQKDKLIPKSGIVEGMKVQFIDVNEYLKQEEKEEFSMFADADGQEEFDFFDDDSLFDDELEIESSVEEIEDIVVERSEAILIIRDKEIRSRYNYIFDKNGWIVQDYVDFNAWQSSIDNPKLLIIDVKIGEEYVVEELKELKGRGKLRDTAIILVGKQYSEAKISECDEFKTIFFARPSSPEEWIMKHVKQWFPEVQALSSSEKDEEMIPVETSIPHVLIVEESPESKTSLFNQLDKSSFTASTAIDATDAISSTQKKHPNLIVIDFDIPRQRGIYLLQTLRANEDFMATPIMILTGSKDRSLAEEALRHGISDFIIKPCPADEFQSRVERVLLDRPMFQQ